MKMSRFKRLGLAGLATAVLLTGGVELAAGTAQAQVDKCGKGHCGPYTTPPK